MNNNKPASQAKPSKTNHLLRLLKMMKGSFYLYLLAIILMGFALSSFHTNTAYMLKDIIQMAKAGTDQGLWPKVLERVFAGLAMILLYQIGFILYTLKAKEGCANLQKEVLRKVIRLPYSYYENTHSGDFMSRIIYDEIRTEDVYGSRFRRILMPSLMVGFYLVPMFALSWQVTSCLLVISVLSFTANSLFVKPMKKVSRQMSLAHSDLSRKLTDILSGIDQIKIFGLGPSMIHDYKSRNQTYKDKQIKMTLLASILESLNRLFDLTSSLVFIVIGLYFVSQGITTVDRLAAIFVIYGNMNWHFLQIGLYVPSLASCLTNASRVFEFLDMPEEPEGYDHILQSKESGYIRMEDVDFAYNKDASILENFTLDIEEGKTVAIKGESGKGKSTIAKLLLGLYPADKGKMTIGGMAYTGKSLNQIRNMIGYVPQDPYLYEVSIGDNIRYGKPDASMEEVIEAAKAANIHDFIISQEKGYDTMTGERGSRLSGGEKQRIAIARAILKNPPILILDEATSALDNESEKLVSEAIEEVMKGRTTIMIAHRPSTLARADRIIEI